MRLRRLFAAHQNITAPCSREACAAWPDPHALVLRSAELAARPDQCGLHPIPASACPAEIASQLLGH
jgi:hypothetical protein